jgi:hypothetical protein
MKLSLPETKAQERDEISLEGSSYYWHILEWCPTPFGLMETKSVVALCQVQEHLITKHEIEDGILGQRVSSAIIPGVRLLIQV